MSAIGKKSKEKNKPFISKETPEEILKRKRELESRVEGNININSNEITHATNMTSEKATGALCFLPKSIHRMATRAAEDRELTSKRFFLETMLIGLEQQGVITPELHKQALQLPYEYGWTGRNKEKTNNDN